MIKWLCLFFSFILMLSAHSWLGLWISMEMNSLSFIPIMIEEGKENSLKYFLIQSVASVIFLASTLNQSLSFLIPLALLIKIGAAPFHMWLVSISKSMSWSIMALLMTFQKIGPLLGLTMIQFTNSFFILVSAMIGGLGGLNQSNLRLIMAFSSVSHLSWLMINMTSFFLVSIYFITYLIILCFVMALLQQKGLFSLTQMGNYTSLMYKTSILFGLLSLAGLPPFLGFFIKWMSLEMNILSPIIVMVLVMSSCFSVYFYFKIAMSALLFPSEMKSKSMEALAILSMMFNILLPLFFL
uniref:NADH-ubiquinone oxidoreductase chain 2 n=1 Tax=Artemia sinica TaxID=112780 RepID=A0A4D6I6S1_9CRUS|nr:NADH dehydrogenase subunit 2 [Artemia sinica]QCC61933.1 NADH dehydrogenase subunit 2 [Artemia sinica]